MDSARISELLEPFLAAPLNESQLAQVSTYMDLLLRWNVRINLTAVGDPDAILSRHFGESFFAARHLLSPPAVAPRARPGPRPQTGEPHPEVTDVGSGAGFPGLPLKIFDPAIHLTLLESNHKKVAFLREVIRALTLTDVEATPRRAEHLPPAFACLVTLRAVERFETVLTAAARLVAPGGRLALLITSPQMARAIDQTPSFRWQDPISTPKSQSRILLIGARTA